MRKDVESRSTAGRFTRFGESWRDWLRITTVRIIVQATMFGLFLGLLLLTTFAHLDRFPGLRLWLNKLLEIDPLIALATGLATHTIYHGLLWSLLILVPTFFLGRFFCNWICPLGTLNQFVRWLCRSPEGRRGDPPRRADGAAEQRKDDSPNRYRNSQKAKYYILAALLVAAALGSLQVGLLDPIALIYRSFTAAVWPAVSMPVSGRFADTRLHQGAWLIGFLFFGLLAANLAYPRFFCRVLCPLGALLGLLSRWAWWRIERDPGRCRGCDRCRLHCEGACDPQARLRAAECLMCFNCIEDCPEGALRFAFLPQRDGEIAGPDLARRKVVLAGVAGLVFYPLVRTTGRATRDFSSQLIRPPGALEELEFLERCVKCEQCARVCPTNVIQPAWFAGGLEGLWSPVLNFRVGHCQLHCTACGYACPTGAIQQLSVARKLGLGEFAAAGPVRLGSAHLDLGRCLPYSAGIPCQVCEEVCPTSPKAIRAVPLGDLPGLLRAGASPPELKVPRVDLSLCIGCGICERHCPVVGDRRAIYVTAEGETRSQARPEPDRNRSLRLPR